jgi:thiamine kinase-like enzyme
MSSLSSPDAGVSPDTVVSQVKSNSPDIPTDLLEELDIDVDAAVSADESLNVIKRGRSGSIVYLNNPLSILPYKVEPWQTDCTSEAVERNMSILVGIKTIVNTLCPLMEGVDASSIKISQLGGGLTNVLYLVTGKEKCGSVNAGKEVYSLVRVAGNSDDQSPERQHEAKVENAMSAFLSKEGVAPLFFGRFINGRVEEFHAGSSTLAYSDLGATDEQIANPNERLSYAYSIAEAFARFHSLQVDGDICMTQPGEAQTWAQTQKWIDVADNYIATVDGCRAKVDEQLNQYGGYDVVRKEWEWLQEYLSKDSKLVDLTPGVAFSRDIVFCHHDIQPLNILSNPDWGDKVVKLIDFEYAGYNPRALDIGNTWCEHTAMTDFAQDYEKQYLSPGQKEFFVDCYLKKLDPDGHAAGKYDETFKNDFITDIDRHSLISHYMWLMWSIKQANAADIEWDYYKYVGVRAEGYYWMKAKLMGASGGA